MRKAYSIFSSLMKIFVNLSEWWVLNIKKKLVYKRMGTVFVILTVTMWSLFLNSTILPRPPTGFGLGQFSAGKINSSQNVRKNHPRKSILMGSV